MSEQDRKVATGTATAADRTGRTPDQQGWAQRILVGRLGARRATFGFLFAPPLLALDAVLRVLGLERGLMPAVVPMVLGVMLVAAAHLLAPEHARQRTASLVLGNVLITVSVVRWVLDLVGL